MTALCSAATFDNLKSKKIEMRQRQMVQPKRIVIDMDEVIADFDAESFVGGTALDFATAP